MSRSLLGTQNCTFTSSMNGCSGLIDISEQHFYLVVSGVSVGSDDLFNAHQQLSKNKKLMINCESSEIHKDLSHLPSILGFLLYLLHARHILPLSLEPSTNTSPDWALVQNKKSCFVLCSPHWVAKHCDIEDSRSILFPTANQDKPVRNFPQVL